MAAADTPTDGSDGAEQVTISREAFDNMRSAARRKDKSKQREQRLERENRLLRAGIDPDSQRGKFLLDSDQELTDAALAEFAGDAQPSSREAEPESEGPELMPGEADQSRERQDLAAGAQPQDGQPEEDPWHEAQRIQQQAMSEGATRVDAMGQAIGAAMASNDRRTFVAQDDRFPADELSDLNRRRP